MSDVKFNYPDDVADSLRRFHMRADVENGLVGHLILVGAKEVDDLIPIYHYYIRNNKFHSEKLLVSHLNKRENGQGYELCDTSKWKRGYPFGLRHNEETGDICEAVEISLFEERLYKGHGRISIWLHSPDEAKAKTYLRSYYTKLHDKTHRRLDMLTYILDQLEPYDAS